MKRAHLCMLAMAACVLTLEATSLAAQQTDETSRRPALVIGGPSTMGFLFPITTRLSLRPDLSITRTTFNVGAAETKFVNVGVGLGVLIGLNREDRVQTYVTPRIALSRNTFDDGSITDLWFFDAAFGVSAPVTGRLALFGEIGPRVTYSDQSNAALVNRTTNLVLRSSLGATFSF